MDHTWKLEIAQEMHDGVMVVALGGRLGTDASGRLADTLLDAIRGGQRRILVDLEAVDYMSSAGLLALDAAATRMRESDGTIVLCAPCEPVRLALELAGLTTGCAVEPSRQAGLERLRR